MQFQVPQNIAMEDRIVLNLTAIQFGIVVIGGGIAFFIFTSTLLPSPINQILGGAFAALTVIIALGKFNDQPLYRFFRFIITFIVTPKVRVWHKNGAEAPVVKPNPASRTKEVVRTVKKVSKQDIARLAVVLDSRGSAGVAPRIQTETVKKPTPPPPENS